MRKLKDKPYNDKDKAIEKDVKKVITMQLKQYPQIWYYMPVPSAYGAHGVPDYIACVPVTITPDMVGLTIGAFAGIEAKRPGKDATDRQADVHAAIRSAGGIVDVISCTNADKVKIWLAKVLRRVVATPITYELNK